MQDDRVYINNDLTKKEREIQTQIRLQANREMKAGKEYCSQKTKKESTGHKKIMTRKKKRKTKQIITKEQEKRRR